MSSPAVELKEETPPQKPAKALPRSAAKLRESTNNSWRVVAPRGTSRERLQHPDFWSVVGDLFINFDKVHVVFEDRSAYCELLVMDCGRGYANVIELAWHPLPPLLICNNDLPPNHEIIHLGPDDLYAVRRCSDGILLGKGFRSRDDALAFLMDHATLR
ncbi:hypothetical protein ACUTAF_19600 [Pseudomonas sp. SP16.1]|uniref:hypothetical protein n=1 Tax=Pseudomonas sp. SP16.1 TaxID=3458854 RepID=UPI00404667F8